MSRSRHSCPEQCKTDYNCSLNGECVSGSCKCDPGWLGSACQQLNLRPVVNGSGLDQLHAKAQTSTWGGTVLHDNSTGKYHMWASEISRNCGLHRWVTNSVVAHAGR